MNLLPETQAVLQSIKDVTGTPVEILQDANQPYLARITRARAGLPAHVIRVNSTLGAPDYVIVYESGFLLRQYAYPPDERRDFAGNDAGRAEVERLIKRAGQTARLPAAAVAQLTEVTCRGRWGLNGKVEPISVLRANVVCAARRSGDWPARRFCPLRGRCSGAWSRRTRFVFDGFLCAKSVIEQAVRTRMRGR